MIPFAIAFAVSFASGIVSWVYLRKVPDVPVPKENRDRKPMPWIKIASHRPFLNLLLYNAVVNAVMGGGIFWVSGVRDLFSME